MVITGIVATSLVFSATAFAASNTTNSNMQKTIGIHQNGEMPIAMGNILSINGNSFTITTRGRGNETETTKTVTVTSDTKYTKDRDTAATISDLLAGQKVMILGTKDDSGNITATTVDIETKAPEFGKHEDKGAMGTIASISGNTITITTRGRGNETETTKTVTVTSDTKYTKDRDTAIALSDLVTGQMIMTQGTKDTSGNITASSINIETKIPEFKGHENRGAMGTIASISGNTITITTRGRGNETETTKTVTVTSDTKYTKDRDTAASLNDLAAGQMIMAQGTKDTSGNITATSVDIATKIGVKTTE